MIDYHVHLWRHEPHLSLQATVDQLAEYCEHSARLGVTELAVTEHTSRFRQFDALVRGWWDEDPSPERRAEMPRIWDAELGADLDRYVRTAVAAKAAGLPVVIGMEVDYIPGRMDKVAALLAGYPFDVLLGSVHWIGAWLFDVLDAAEAQRHWQTWGNSSGWRKPCAEAYPAPPLLARFHAYGVPVTTASDGHQRDHVSWRIGELTAMARAAGYSEISVFRGRRRQSRPL